MANASGYAISGLVDMTEGAGAAERANAQGFAQLAAAAGDVENLLIAHQRSVEAGQLAAIKSAADAQIEAAHTAHMNDPTAFQATIGEFRKSLVTSVNPRMARAAAAYIDQRAIPLAGDLTRRKMLNDQQTAVMTLKAREQALEDDVVANGSELNGRTSNDFLQRLTEWDSIQEEKAANPLIHFDKTQAAIARAALLERVEQGAVNLQSEQVYVQSGGGEKGRIAARRFLERSILGVERATAVETVPGVSVPLVAPVQGRVTSGFGQRARPTAGASTNHNGVDYAVPVGTPVAAAGPGTVIKVGSDPKSGNFVIVDHGNGVTTSYAHLSAAHVKKGDPVTAGQVVAKSGKTGTTTGPNLHYVVKKDGKAVDPEGIALAAAPQTRRTETIRTADAGGLFPDMAPPKRNKVFREAMRHLDDLSKVDREQEALDAKIEREADQARRETAGTLALAIATGEAGEKDVLAAVAADQIDDAAGARLIASTKAAARREQREDRAERSAAYGRIRDDAVAGTMTDGELASHINAGVVTPGEAQTLKVLRNRTLKPVVDNILAPVRDELKKPARASGGRGNAVLWDRAEAMAVRAAAENPNASLADRFKMGEAIAKSVFGTAQGPATRQAAVTDKSRAFAALAAQHRAKPFTASEFERRRKEIRDGR